MPLLINDSTGISFNPATKQIPAARECTAFYTVCLCHQLKLGLAKGKTHYCPCLVNRDLDALWNHLGKWRIELSTCVSPSRYLVFNLPQNVHGTHFDVQNNCRSFTFFINDKTRFLRAPHAASCYHPIQTNYWE